MVIKFVPVEHVFKPQRQVRLLKDVTGWVNGDKRTGKKWHMRCGDIQYLDNRLADEFIIKGYAMGELSREYSEMERSEILATITNIGLPSPRETEAAHG